MRWNEVNNDLKWIKLAKIVCATPSDSSDLKKRVVKYAHFCEETRAPFNGNQNFQWTSRIDILARISTGVSLLKAAAFLEIFTSQESGEAFLLAMLLDEFSDSVGYTMQPPHGTINARACDISPAVKFDLRFYGRSVATKWIAILRQAAAVSSMSRW